MGEVIYLGSIKTDEGGVGSTLSVSHNFRIIRFLRRNSTELHSSFIRSELPIYFQNNTFS